MTRDDAYTVTQLSNLAGTSVRTLHYYDEIGLLKPDCIRPNGYREYGEKAVMKLQQILFYRELDLSLNEIKLIISSPDFDVMDALQAHKQALGLRVERLKSLIRTVDNTILHLKGNKEMSKKQLFAAFTEEEEKKYAAEAEQMYDPEIVRASQKKWKTYTREEKERIGDEGNAVYEAIVAAIPLGPGSPEAQAGVEMWRKHMNYFWTPNPEQLLGLAEMYNTEARFKANFDKFDPRLAEFMLEAVKVYVGKSE
jgi:MerR family transcriptional regulator, thiopeptide resistance regulator